MLPKQTLASVLVVFACAFSISGQQPLQSDQFYQAIRNNDIPALRALVAEHGVDVKDAAGQTPLILAAAFGSRDAVKLLVDAGADVRVASTAGVTALHVAWRDEAVVRMLLDHGADVNAKTALGTTLAHQVIHERDLFRSAERKRGSRRIAATSMVAIADQRLVGSVTFVTILT